VLKPAVIYDQKTPLLKMLTESKTRFIEVPMNWIFEQENIIALIV